MGFLKKLFGGESKEETNETSDVSTLKPSGASVDVDGIQDLEMFVDYVVKALVDNKSEVSVNAEQLENAISIKIKCQKEEIGKVVGKKGRTIMAIRTLISGAAGRLQKRILVEVVE